MNCGGLQELVGMHCNQIGNAIEVVTPFTFYDGDSIELFAKSYETQILFFDDGFTLHHLHDAGIRIANNKKRWSPIKEIAGNYGVSLSEDGVLETLCSSANPSQGFARMVSALLGIASWEREQAGVEIDTAWLIDEVAIHLKAWKPNAAFVEKPKVRGFSGRVITFDFEFDGQYIDAIGPHSASTGAALRKVVDLNSNPNHEKKEVLVIVDDRQQPELAKQEMGIIGRVASTWSVSSLIAKSGFESARQ
jgi:hypothetical protein